MNEIHKNGLLVKSENESNKGSIGILGTGRTLSIIPQPNFPAPTGIITNDQFPSQRKCHRCKKNCGELATMIRHISQKEWYCSYECSDRDNELFKCKKCNNFAGIYENGELITMGCYLGGGYCCLSCSEKLCEELNRNLRRNQNFFSTDNEEQQKEESSVSSNYSTGSYYPSSNVEPEIYQEDTKTHQTSPATNSINNNSEPELVPHKAANNNSQEELEKLNDFQSTIDVEQQQQQITSAILAKRKEEAIRQEQINNKKTIPFNQETKKTNSSSVPLIIGGIVITGSIIFAGLTFIKKKQLKRK